MPKRWRPASSGNFFYGIWDDSDEVVLYYSGSGETYLITRLGYIILNQLKESAQSKDELIASLSNGISGCEDETGIPEEMIDSHLFHLEKLGLIET